MSELRNIQERKIKGFKKELKSLLEKYDATIYYQPEEGTHYAFHHIVVSVDDYLPTQDSLAFNQTNSPLTIKSEDL